MTALPKSMSLTYVYSVSLHLVKLSSYFEFLIYNEVLVFDIAMSYTSTVEIIDGLDNLSEDILSLIYGQTFHFRLFDTLK